MISFWTSWLLIWFLFETSSVVTYFLIILYQINFSSKDFVCWESHLDYCSCSWASRAFDTVKQIFGLDSRDICFKFSEKMKEVQCGYLEPLILDVQVDLDVSLIEEEEDDLSELSDLSNAEDDDPMDFDSDLDSDNLNHVCGICNDRFRNRREIMNHFETVHPFSCFCSRMLINFIFKLIIKNSNLQFQMNHGTY